MGTKVKLGGQDVRPQIIINAPPREDEASDSWTPQREDEGGSKEENMYPEIITVQPVRIRGGHDKQAPPPTGESDRNHSQEDAVRYALPLNLRRLIP